MASKKYLDPNLHSTRGTRNHTKYGLTGRVTQGQGFSKKANLKYTYTNFQQEGKTNIIKWE